MSHPKFGTTPIRCGRTHCSWRGHETDLKQVPGSIGGVRCTNNVCPTCGCDSYSYMTAGEIKAWERKKALKEKTDRPARDTANPCALCGWSEHMAIHQPVKEGPRKGQPWGHEYKPKDTQ